MLRQGGEITEQNTQGCRPMGGVSSTQVVQDHINQITEAENKFINDQGSTNVELKVNPGEAPPFQIS